MDNTWGNSNHLGAMQIPNGGGNDQTILPSPQSGVD